MHTQTHIHRHTQPCVHTHILYIIYHTREIFGRGRFWQTMQVKAIGKEKFGKKATVIAYAIICFRDATIHILDVSMYHLFSITIQRYIARYGIVRNS